jgi:plasmid stabilization system protein ParE
MIFKFHESAEKELLDAIDYYESSEPGLGFKFSGEVLSAIYRICEHPQAWTEIDAQTRRCLTQKFPYGILYRIVENEILIMAVMHLHRKPDYWKER